VLVRPYRSTDREDVRRICHLTGLMGSPVDWFWRDRESFADAITSYYTDCEPESALVAVAEKKDAAPAGAPAGAVTGYLLGCVDSRRVPPLSTALLPHLIGRGLLVRPGTAGVMWRGLADILLDVAAGRGLPDQAFRDERYPSHLHIDLLRDARGAGIGPQLISTYFDHLKGAGSPGCHLETFAENKAAIRYFEREGFVIYGEPRPLPGWRTRDGGKVHIQVMVRSLRPA